MKANIIFEYDDYSNFILIIEFFLKFILIKILNYLNLKFVFRFCQIVWVLIEIFIISIFY